MFGERLNLARKRAGLSLRGLSDAIGGQVSAQAIGKYERGEMKPNSTVLISLAKALKVPVGFFMSQNTWKRRPNKSRRLTAEVAAEIKKLGSTTDLAQHEIAARLRINQGRVSEVLSGQCFANVAPMP